MKGIYYKSPNEIPDELPGENIILLVSSVLEKKTCDGFKTYGKVAVAMFT